MLFGGDGRRSKGSAHPRSADAGHVAAYRTAIRPSDNASYTTLTPSGPSCPQAAHCGITNLTDL